jgi:NDP-sugar pyrophosphorylase family protein
MQALILAGGKGTRLRPLTVYTPKPIVPVVNRPFLIYQIEILKAAGITDITLSLSYQPDKIQHVLGNGSDYDINLRYITEPTPLGTGGAYKFAANSFRETTIVLNGDVLTDIDLTALIEFHKNKSAVATLTLVPVADPSRYGLVQVDKQSLIQSFVEKPKPGTKTPTNTINAGIYVLEPEVLDLMASDTTLSFEYDVFPLILEKEMPFFGCVVKDRYWLDIGTPATYLAAHHDFLAGRIKAPVPLAGSETEVATHAEIDRLSVLGEGCMVKPGAEIINSVIGQGVHIEERARIENSVIWPHTRIAAAAEVRDAIIGRSCHIGRNAIVSGGSVIGDKTTLTDYTRV